MRSRRECALCVIGVEWKLMRVGCSHVIQALKVLMNNVQPTGDIEVAEDDLEDMVSHVRRHH